MRYFPPRAAADRRKSPHRYIDFFVNLKIYDFFYPYLELEGVVDNILPPFIQKKICLWTYQRPPPLSLAIGSNGHIWLSVLLLDLQWVLSYSSELYLG